MTKSTNAAADALQRNVFEALDKMAQNNVQQLFSAQATLCATFGFDYGTAKRYIAAWQKTYAQRHPSEG